MERYEQTHDWERLQRESYQTILKLKEKKAAVEASPSWEELIEKAKVKMNAGDFQGALADFKRAQKIKDTSELQKWIQACRKKLETKKVTFFWTS